ncbi:MAG: quinone-interacting membrane-bound oxidoreductase complex subunit QmoC [Planctomycetota bacterium]
MGTATPSAQGERETDLRESPQLASAHSANGSPVRVNPDLDFIRLLSRQGGSSLKKCFQCGTCSATCDLSPDREAFPRKEMAWAVWGMKDHLLRDPDVWLCYQCNDCSTTCPRGARPGAVLGAVREACVRRYAVGRFLGRWMNQPHCLPLVLGIAAALLTLALLVRDPIADALTLARSADGDIVYAYSGLFPHWLLNAFFGFFTGVAVLVVLVGVVRFWRAMKAALPGDRRLNPTRGLLASIATTLGRIILHDRFDLCTKARSRLLSHICVLFGFIALTLVTFWVITARYNPLIQGEFVYPFGLWSPWKMLANAGGIAVAAGCLLMSWDRLRDNERTGGGSYFDWALIVTLLVVVVSGAITEVLHYLRLEPHRHIAYFMHLVFVLVLLMSLPYSKLAHVAYRSTALVFTERFGWSPEARRSPMAQAHSAEQDGPNDVEHNTAAP